MRSFGHALSVAAALAGALLLFGAFCAAFRTLVVGMPLPPIPWQRPGEVAGALIECSLLTFTALAFGSTWPYLAPHADGLRTRDGRGGILLVLFVSIGVSLAISRLTHRGTVDAESLVSGLGAVVFAGLGRFSLKHAEEHSGGSPETARVLSGARAERYQRMKERQYVDPSDL